MTASPKKPGVAFWATVAMVVVLVAYPLSYGPACWLVGHRLLPNWTMRPLEVFYRPIGWLYKYGPTPVRNAVVWYHTPYWPRRR